MTHTGQQQQYDDDADPGLAPEEISGEAERRYIIPAQDAKGHSIRLQFRAMPAVGRLLGDLVSSRKFPFRQHGDAIRWCVVEGVKRLLTEQGIPSVIAHVDAMHAVLLDEEFQIQFREYFNRLRAVVDHYIEAKADGEARRVVSHARANLSAMKEGYWRERYLTELMERYGRLLDGDGVGVEMGGDE